jgi:hypothetical protein
VALGGLASDTVGDEPLEPLSLAGRDESPVGRRGVVLAARDETGGVRCDSPRAAVTAGAAGAAPAGAVEGAEEGGGAGGGGGGGGGAGGATGGGGGCGSVIVGVVTGSVGAVIVGRLGKSIAQLAGAAMTAAPTPASASAVLAMTKRTDPPNGTSVQLLSRPDGFGLRPLSGEED